MVRMKVSAQEALSLFSRIGHEKFQQGVRTRWRTYVDDNGKEQATVQSICWLFVWAATGMNSADTARQAQAAFDRIFDHSYDWLDQRLPIEVARRFRYEPGDIEQQFCSYLK